MKRYIAALLVAASVCCAGCGGESPAGETTDAPVREEGNAAVYRGWLEQEGRLYFYGMDGVQRTGWMESDGKKYYLDPNAGGAAHKGWLSQEGERYYFGTDGVMCTGWTEIDGQRYFFESDGSVYTGWLQQGSQRYYLRSDGTAARGIQRIDGKDVFFTAAGVQIQLVNPWNAVSESYTTETVSVGDGHRVSPQCSDALLQMLADCRAAGLDPVIASSFRTWADQEYLHERKVLACMQMGYSEAEARALAGTEVAVPGTSEHQLGLAVDLVDSSNRNLDETQEQTPVQQWLMKNSWRYGFILRYPNGKSESTGIIYEPWHYRYVGKEAAKLIYESGLCLEEYLEKISN